MNPGQRAASKYSEDVDRLFRRLQQEKDPEKKAAVREEIIAANTPLVHALAGRFRDRGEPLEDLIQVGMVGLINAVDRFDPSKGYRFATFATPTIVGEIKRYFRDKGWTMRVPRRLQELRLLVNRAIDELSHELRRSPTVAEIADRVGAPAEDVEMAMELDLVYDLVSLDTSRDEDDETRPYEAQVAAPESRATEDVLARTDLEEAIQSLPERQRRIVIMKFFKDMTQAEIAKALRMSQMHVSRLQHLALLALRRRLEQGNGDRESKDSEVQQNPAKKSV